MFVISEIGINHNGDIDIAKKLIKASKDGGANAVKFQKRTIDLVYSKEKLDSLRDSPWGKTEREQKEGLEFGIKEYKEIDEYCKKIGIEWFASAWDIESQKFLKQFNLKYNKIASAMNVDLNFIDFVAKEKKYTFLSTGMSTMEDIEKAVDIFKTNNCEFEIMHCVATYPTDVKDSNLLCINTLRDKFKCKVGLSSHEAGTALSIGAAALGITSLERHITLNRSMYGSDQSASLEPSGFKFVVGAARKVQEGMGDGKKVFLDKELPIAKKLRAHIK
jgi:N-acetylneuraminate synthase